MTDNIAQLEAELTRLTEPSRRMVELQDRIAAAKLEAELDKARAILRQSQADYMAIRPMFEQSRRDFEAAKAAFAQAKEAWQAALDTEQDRFAALRICRDLARTAGLSMEEVNLIGSGLGGGGNNG